MYMADCAFQLYVGCRQPIQTFLEREREIEMTLILKQIPYFSFVTSEPSKEVMLRFSFAAILVRGYNRKRTIGSTIVEHHSTLRQRKE